MNVAIKKKWLAALRGGKYKQCEGFLRKGGGHCCLGVLTDLYVKDTKRSRWPTSWALYGELPEAVAKWAGLKTADPACARRRLSCHNDGQATSAKKFPQIADLIEKHL